MPPKVKVTKETIINAAVEIVKESGASALNTRNLASKLNCSTQPVFSNFSTMEDLKFAVIQKADQLFNKYMKTEIESGKYPDFKASGMAYIRFAKEQKELFKLLYMRDRSDENFVVQDEQTLQIQNMICKNTGLDPEQAKLFHLEIWAYVHGIATMFATGFFDLEWELVSKMLTDSYMGLLMQFETEK